MPGKAKSQRKISIERQKATDESKPSNDNGGVMDVDGEDSMSGASDGEDDAA